MKTNQRKGWLLLAIGALLLSVPAPTQAHAKSESTVMRVTNTHSLIVPPPVQVPDKKLNKKKRKKLPIVHTRYERKIPDSKYRGKYYAPKFESTRKCIVWRESNGKLRVTNPSGAGGLYQFMPSTWRAYTGLPGGAQNYSRKVQDRAFWKAWNHGKGKNHWRYGANYPCW